MLEVICGPMFSGKTEELIRRLNRAKIAKLKVDAFKPILDDRYDASSVTSHEGNQIVCKPLQVPGSLHEISNSFADVIGIDEAQFFDENLVELVDFLAYTQKKRIIVAGLDLDSFGKPFGIMPELLCRADEIEKLTAVCIKCGNQMATRTQRLDDSKEQILVGAIDKYQAVCRRCFYDLNDVSISSTCWKV